MKNILCLILISILVLFALPVKASEPEDHTNEAMLTDLIKEQYASKVEEMLDPERFAEELKNVDLTCPILPIYYGTLQWCVDMASLEEMSARCINPYENHSFVIFDETPFKVRRYKEGGTMIDIDSYETVPLYIQDIQTGTVHQTFLGAEYEIMNVYCFTLAHSGTSVAYETDGGIFIRYYENNNAEAVEYAWDDYVEYSLAWQEYMNKIISNQLGHPIGGCGSSFNEFVEEYKAQKEAQRQAELEAQTRKWLLISVTGVVVLGTATATILTLRRKRRNATAQ